MRNIRNIAGWTLALGAVVSIARYDPAGQSSSPAAVMPKMPLCPSGCRYRQDGIKMLDAAFPYAEMVSPPTCPYHKS